GWALLVTSDRKVHEQRRNELGLAQGAPPAAHRYAAPQMPSLNDEQRMKEFLAEEVAAPAVIGEGRKPPDNGIPAGQPAEIALDAPQRNDEARLHAELLADLVEQAAVLLEKPAPPVDSRVVDDPRQVVAERDGGFG